MFNAIVNIAGMSIGILHTLGCIGGLLFLVLAIAYVYENNADGNLFWFLDAYDDDDDDDCDDWTKGFVDGDWEDNK